MVDGTGTNFNEKNLNQLENLSEVQTDLCSKLIGKGTYQTNLCQQKDREDMFCIHIAFIKLYRVVF